MRFENDRLTSLKRHLNLTVDRSEAACLGRMWIRTLRTASRNSDESIDSSEFEQASGSEIETSNDDDSIRLTSDSFVAVLGVFIRLLAARPPTLPENAAGKCARESMSSRFRHIGRFLRVVQRLV